MIRENATGYPEALQKAMAPHRKADFKPLGRTEFEARYVEPHRRPMGLWSGGRLWVAAGFAVAVIAVGLIILPKISQKTSALELVATGELKSFKVENLGEVFARNARLVVTNEGSAVRADLLDGECLIYFTKDIPQQRTLRIGQDDFTITGTIVFVSTSDKLIAIIEGEISDSNGKIIAAANERNLTNGVHTPLSTNTITKTLALSDISAYLSKSKSTPPKEESLADKIFHKYGNVYSVVLKSNATIFAAKVKDPESGLEKLFTLKGPLYVSEADIREVKRIR